jgi:hypothetical protein
MFFRKTLTSLFALSSFTLITYADENSCGETIKSMRTSIRHIEGKGVGYTLGYTSFDLFLASSTPMRRWVPFLTGAPTYLTTGSRLSTQVSARVISPLHGCMVSTHTTTTARLLTITITSAP